MRAFAHPAAWMLPTIYWVYLSRAGYFHEWAAAQHGALAVAQRLGDPRAQAHVRRCLGAALTRLARNGT